MMVSSFLLLTFRRERGREGGREGGNIRKRIVCLPVQLFEES